MKKLGVTLTPSGDALRHMAMDSAVTATGAEQQAEPVLDAPAGSLHGNASSNLDALPPATALGDHLANEPDWLDIDNIIQSFLHGREGAHAPPGFEPDTAWLPAPSLHNMAGAPSTTAAMYPPSTESSGYFHPQDESGSSDGFVHDPLFGFNGSTTDSYHYASWTSQITRPDSLAKKTSDIRVQAYSMGLPHPSLQPTGAVCLASALCSPGTTVAELAGQAVLCDGDGDALLSPKRTPSPPVPGAHERSVIIAHSKGTIQVGVQLDEAGGVRGCTVSRTARRLFEGKV
ncbi:putative isomerase YraM [Emericellopsis cladophorae]|uniref:Isomerase YraM n=1 Tax=Emericellopsis cladophorae TaxID=2686198 RepID=A0A9P9XUA6_9HYPO|nr:putative isomerase YraM [Emericellopsis cladophorae]KAI6777909.1 putative isomerase YraM [Emericellopsis cladophorae]